MATLRWMGVPEAEVRMVECTYEETKYRVVCGQGISEDINVHTTLLEGLFFLQILTILYYVQFPHNECSMSSDCDHAV